MGEIKAWEGRLTQLVNLPEARDFVMVNIVGPSAFKPSLLSISSHDLGHMPSLAFVGFKFSSR